MKRIVMATALALACAAAIAGGPGKVRKEVESSRLVKGTIDVAPDGHVLAYSLDKADTLPESIRTLAASAIPAWRFAPVELEGGATAARAFMHLRLVVKKLESGDFSLRIAGASFEGKAPAKDETVRADRLETPHYPRNAVIMGVGGTVYAVLKIGRDGHVEDAVAEQVNLWYVADDTAMSQWRGTLAEAALAAARRWHFTPPRKGPNVDAPYWSVRIPFDFVPPGTQGPGDSEWETYVPGPRSRVPWITDQSSVGAPDTVAAGDVQMLDSPFKLHTPIPPNS